MAKLVIADDQGSTREISLDASEITLGRSEDSSVRLDERNVSRKHARIRADGERFILEDVGSYLGTRINGEVIAEPRALENGDLIEIGDFALKALELSAASDDSLATCETGAQLSASTGTASGRLRRGGRSSHPPTTSPDVKRVAKAGEERAGANEFPRIVMVSPPAPGTEYVLKGSKLRVGRAEDLDVWVNHRSISREHADFVIDGAGKVTVIDRGSANGTRIDGEEVWERQLASRDLLQLGQVSFRFVPALEHYVFDVGDTVDLLALKETGRNRGWVWALAAAALLLGAAGIFALSGEPAPGIEEVALEAPEPPANEDEAEPREDTPEASAIKPEALLAACAEAVAAQDLEHGREVLRRLQTKAVSGSQACAEGVGRLSEDNDAFQRGKAALAAEDLAGAYRAFSGISPAAFQRADPVVEATMQRYAEAHIDAAEVAFANDKPTTIAEASKVLAMGDDAPPRLVEKARSLRERAERTLLDERTAKSKPEERVASRTRPASGPSAARTAGVEAANKASDDQTCSPLAPNYSQCVVTSLEGKTTTPNQLALLIESYRQLGKAPKAQAHMEDFVRRFPSHRLAAHYRQVLMRAGE